MNPDPKRVKEVFVAASKLAPAQWDAFLAEACGPDDELRRRVRHLLDAHLEAGSFLESPAALPRPPLTEEGQAVRRLGATLDQPIPEAPGTVIGPYKLLEQIGEGGMGTVWMAQQTEPVKRLVAVKLIKPGMDSKQVIARFEAERQALALMDHPNIAKVFDGGMTSDRSAGGSPARGAAGEPPALREGRPYFVMELVKGQPITKYCDEHHLTPRQRLELFMPVCQAIQHAHQKGIIHRDLKPSNVLIALYDGKPVPKVIDFGVAKAAGQSLTDKTLVTGFGNIVGTLEYMSPEQAELNNQDIDTRSDIYSLGVLLYELLTGSTPFTRKELEKAGMLEMLRVIREQEPSKPSTKLSTAEGLPTLAANRGTEPTKLTKLVRGELDWIVMKALEKDRDRRYETANGFAMDVQRYLADEAVLACPPSVGYRFRKFARRNKRGLAAAAVMGIAVLVAVGAVAGSLGWMARERETRQAKVAGQVELIFADVDQLEKEQKWPEALSAARRAEAAMTGGEVDAATAHRVRALLKDLEFIDRLEQIRMQRATPVAGTFDCAGADRDYARAFRDYGVDVDLLPVETSIDRLNSRPALAIPLAAALDDWVYTRVVTAREDVAGRKRLVAIARGIDPEPLRDLIRATWRLPDSEAQDELHRLADSIDVRAHHPATLMILPLRQVKRSESVLRLLRDAQYVYPGDFWLNIELGAAMYEVQDHDAAIRYFSAAVSIRPNSASAHLCLGAVLCDGKHDYAGAVICFRRAIELDQKHTDAYYNLGNALLGQKKLNEAIDCYRKAIELDPKYVGAYYNIGNVLLGQKKQDEAIDYYRRVIELDPKHALAHYNLGIALRDQKKQDEAITALRKAIEHNPNSFDSHLSLGAVLCDGKHDYAGAADCFRRAIELDPKRAPAHYNLGIALKRQGKLDEAIASYRKAIELDPKLLGAHLALGANLCDGKHDYEGAAACFRKAIELDPKHVNAYFNLGNALKRQGKLDEAIAAYRKAVELDPKHLGAQLTLGANLCDGKRDYEGAAACFRKVIELDPKNVNAHFSLGNALQGQGKSEQAIAAYREAIRLKSDLAAAYFGLGNALTSIGALGDAIAQLQKSIELDPKNARCANRLAWMLATGPDPKYRNGRLAVELAKKAVALSPKEELYWLTLAWAQYRAGDWEAAIAAVQKVENQGSALDSVDWFLLAMAHWQLGHQDEARKWYDRAVAWMDKNQPNDEELRRFRVEAAEVLGVKEKKKM